MDTRWTAATGGTLLLIGAAPLTVAGLIAASAARVGARPDRLAAWSITFAALGLVPWVLLMLLGLRTVVIACRRDGGACG